MTLSVDEIVIGGTGRLYVAPEGTPMPSYLSDALNAAFVDVGYITEDGAMFTDSKETNDVRPWQSFYPVRVHITERTATLEYTLMQWNEANLITAYGGGGVFENSPGGGEFRYEPPEPDELAVNALVLDVTDGDRHFRVGVARAFVTSNTETTFAKTGPALLPITHAVLANSEEKPWFIDSDDPAWAPVAS
jgi:hypothetical protein